jgi:hypothetical protein
MMVGKAVEQEDRRMPHCLMIAAYMAQMLMLPEPGRQKPLLPNLIDAPIEF